MAAQSGTVLKSEYDTKLGNYVVLQHENGVVTTYAHGSELLVNEGDSVDKGETVMLSGSTGYSTGPHLHFGVSVDGKSVDPANYIIVE